MLRHYYVGDSLSAAAGGLLPLTELLKHAKDSLRSLARRPSLSKKVDMKAGIDDLITGAVVASDAALDLEVQMVALGNSSAKVVMNAARKPARSVLGQAGSNSRSACCPASAARRCMRAAGANGAATLPAPAPRARTGRISGPRRRYRSVTRRARGADRASS